MAFRRKGHRHLSSELAVGLVRPRLVRKRASVALVLHAALASCVCKTRMVYTGKTPVSTRTHAALRTQLPSFPGVVYGFFVAAAPRQLLLSLVHRDLQN